MSVNQAVDWLATHKQRQIAPASLQKTNATRLSAYGLRRDQGLYYPI
jgi:hypothetical protein